MWDNNAELTGEIQSSQRLRPTTKKKQELCSSGLNWTFKMQVKM